MILKHIMLMVADINASREFFTTAFGLREITFSPMWCELDLGGISLALHTASHSEIKTGDSPILSFQVTDIHASVEHIIRLGGILEGEIREPSFGKVAAMRSPDGHLISLLEPRNSKEKHP